MNLKILCSLLTLAIASAGMAAESRVFEFESSTQRILLSIDSGSVTVNGTDNDSVELAWECETSDPPDTSDRQPGEFRQLAPSVVEPYVQVTDEIIAIRTEENSPACAISLTVPDWRPIELRVNRRGAIETNRLKAALVAWSADGDIAIENQSGPVSVTAMSGSAQIELDSVANTGDSAVTVANGLLTVTLRGDELPQLRAQSRGGEIRTNLNIDFREETGPTGPWFVSAAAENNTVLTLRNLNNDIIISRGEDTTPN